MKKYKITHRLYEYTIDSWSGKEDIIFISKGLMKNNNDVLEEAIFLFRVYDEGKEIVFAYASPINSYSKGVRSTNYASHELLNTKTKGNLLVLLNKYVTPGFAEFYV